MERGYAEHAGSSVGDRAVLRARRSVRVCHGAPSPIRSGLILPVVLLILSLVALLACAFAMQVNADYAANQAMVNRLQTRMAAEAGFQYVGLMLRDDGLKTVDSWYDNPEKFKRVLVWSATGGKDEFGPDEDFDGQREEENPGPAYRFSLVADDPADDEAKVRYGLTDESAKLNINTATSDQLTKLIKQVAPEDADVTELVNCLLDWRDPDDAVRDKGAEKEYYNGLQVAYQCKNAAFDTVEELLMVKGFTGTIMYGEDLDRNGLLRPNEDDGAVSLPIDNEDGQLNRGLYPYITVYSKDYNRATDNKPRILLNGENAEKREKLGEWFEPGQVDYLLGRTAGKGKATARSLSVFVDMSSTNGLNNPFALEDLPLIMDRCTLNPSPELHGRVNVNTAPPIVLRCLGSLAAEEVVAIVEKRSELGSDEKETTAWLLTHEVLDRAKYDEIDPFITARGLQFTAEIVGFADHLGVRSRLQIVFAMRGPVPQIMYYRDITNLGVNYPLTRQEEEDAEGLKDAVDGETTG